MKRFTDTEKWRDPWFQQLDKAHRILWLWLCDRADNAGVIDICWPICNAETLENFTEKDMEKMGDRVEKLENGKWFLRKFTVFQFGKLSSKNPVHHSIELLLSKHGISDRVGHKVVDRVSPRVAPRAKEKEKEKDKEKDRVVPDVGDHVVTTPEGVTIVDDEETFWSDMAQRFPLLKIGEEKRRMFDWARKNGRSVTRGFVVNWLKKAEPPLSAPVITEKVFTGITPEQQAKMFPTLNRPQ